MTRAATAPKNQELLFRVAPSIPATSDENGVTGVALKGGSF